MPFLRHLLSAASVTAALTACSPSANNAKCPASSVDLSSWPRANAQFYPVSFVVPPNAASRVLPTGTQSPGEGFHGNRIDMYYLHDSVWTIRTPEITNLVQDVVSCTEDIGGHEAKVDLLFSNATGMSGQSAQATWKLPHKGSFYITMLAPNREARDTLLAVIRSVKFNDEKK